jgi:hypothetical protein
MHLLKKRSEIFYFSNFTHEFTNFLHVNKNYVPGFKKAVQTI